MATVTDFYELAEGWHRAFPAHGWLESAHGARVIKLPLMRLYGWGSPTYKQFEKYGLAGVWLQFRSPHRTLRNLGVCLRDIHQEAREMLRVVGFEDAPVSDERDAALNRQHEGIQRLEVLLIAAFTLLRRLGDEIVNTARPFLFEHWQSAHQELKNAIPAAGDGTLAKLKPMCDLAILEDTLVNRTAWFSQLRDTDGIRDIIIHKPHFLQIGPAGTSHDGGTTWNYRIDAHLLREAIKGSGGSVRIVSLIPALLSCTKGACHFMQGIVESVGWPTEYERGDILSVTGSDNDIVGCWPRATGDNVRFPILD